MKRTLSWYEFYCLCPNLGNRELSKFGFPYRSGAGYIYNEDVDLMLHVVENNPGLHVLSYVPWMYGYNYYRPNSQFYKICRGDADPNIEVSPHIESPITITKEQLAKEIAQINKLLENCYDDPVFIAIRNHTLKRFGQK